MDWQQSRDKYLYVILIFALVIRLSTLFFIPTNPLSDAWSYFQRASSLADKGIYEDKKGIPDASYPPGYPILLSLIFHSPLPRLAAAKVLNIALSLASIFFLYHLTRHLFGIPEALLASLMYTLSPRYILLPLAILSENLFLPLLLAWALLTVVRKPSNLSAAISGTLLGCLALTRSIAFLLIVPWFIYQYLKASHKMKAFYTTGIAFLAQLLIMLPWGIRNAEVLGQPTLLTTTSGINLFLGNNPNATGYWYPLQDDIEQIEPGFGSYSIIKQNKTARNEALKWIAHHPKKFFQLYTKKLLGMFKNDRFIVYLTMIATDISPPVPDENALPSSHPALDFAPMIRQINDLFYKTIISLQVISILLLIGKTVGSDKTFQRPWIFLILIGLYFPFLSAVFITSPRFRWPTSIIWLPFAPYCLIELTSWLTHPIQILRE